MAIDLSHFEQPRLTFGESLGPAMQITEQADADAYLAAYVDWIARNQNTSTEAASALALNNLGYYAGYYSEETRRRTERLFGSAHPVFGPIARNGPPSVVDAVEAGLGRRL